MLLLRLVVRWIDVYKRQTLCSCGGSQNENLNLTLSKDALFDKVKGAWACLLYTSQPIADMEKSMADRIMVRLRPSLSLKIPAKSTPTMEPINACLLYTSSREVTA